MYTPGIRIVYHFWYTNAPRPHMRTTLSPAGIEPVHVRVPLIVRSRPNGAYVEAAVTLKFQKKMFETWFKSFWLPNRVFPFLRVRKY